MTNLRKLALAASFPVTLYACATALEIEGDIDIVAAAPFQPVGPGSDPDAGLGGTNMGAAGNGLGGNSSGGGTGGSGTGGNGTGGNGTGGNGGGTGGAGSAGTTMSGNAGMGGSSLGGTGGMANFGGSGMGGAAGAGVDAGTGGGAGGAAQSVFDPAACNFNDETGCEAFNCTQCDNQDCQNRCDGIQACVVGGNDCITVEDPLCAVRVGNTNSENTCTTEVEQGGGVGNAQANSPASFMYEWVDCMCQTGRL